MQLRHRTWAAASLIMLVVVFPVFISPETVDKQYPPQYAMFCIALCLGILLKSMSIDESNSKQVTLKEVE